jgi:hypothetical protein
MTSLPFVGAPHAANMNSYFNDAIPTTDYPLITPGTSVIVPTITFRGVTASTPIISYNLKNRVTIGQVFGDWQSVQNMGVDITQANTVGDL